MDNFSLKMDKKDIDILWELFQNSRSSLSEISKVVKLPKPTIKYRIDQLKKKGILKKTYSIFNRSPFNFTGHEIFIKLQGITKENERKAIEKIKKNPFVVWFVKLSGRFNFICTVFTRDPIDFLKAYDEIKEAFHPYVRDISLSLRARSRRFTYPFFKGRSIRRNSTKNSPDIIELNDKQKKLLELLSNNSQVPLVKLAEKTKMSEKTVRNQIKNFEKIGVITRHTAEIDPTKLGYFSHVIIISLKKYDNELEEYLRNVPEIAYLAMGAGLYDLRAEFFTENENRIYEIEQELYSKFGKPILSIDVMMFKKEYLLNYFTGALESTKK